MKVKLLIMDVDGTLTDGKIFMGNSGEVLKAFNIKDGFGICKILPEYGIVPIIVTGRKSEIVDIRCKELGINHCYQGITDKVVVLEKIASKFKLKKYKNQFNEIAYIGDDLQDYECIKMCGITGSPKDAVPIIKENVDFVSTKCGGEGAVREFIEWFLTL